ncbi:family 16 glycosylhydrolase [Flammeovirga agarivorans]|uniref:Family 16 glycosylhydrolase n=1 Tax=Flammeovirga agarivorans TaxID=2726742 RepID=A0A7X8SK27_9BACT|nr:family 16 glycosylhydrolase [Flammeovirga agarivorans]NLR91656.1 family 16 glycosylhydrolase [Flammeovirga agarivorans]
MKIYYSLVIKTLLILSSLLLFTKNANAQNLSCRELLWSDEFDYTGAPDPSIWVHEIMGVGANNNELQAYVNDRKNSRVEDGLLIIEATESETENEYASARLFSNTPGHRTLHGRIEVRAKLPSGRGTWPAIWMMPENWQNSNYGGGGWPNTGEIDIMEHVGYEEGVVHATTHTYKYNWGQGTQKTDKITVPTVTTEFHNYVVEWTPNRMEFYVDDALFFTTYNDGTGWEAWPFTQPFAVLLNVAVGGDWGGAVKVDNDLGVDVTIFDREEGVKMLVDYVRVYEVKDHLIGESLLETNATVTFTASEGKDSYNWHVPEGYTILSGEGTNTIEVQVSDESGGVSVDMETSCGTTSDVIEVLVRNNLETEVDYIIDDFSTDQLEEYNPPTGDNNFTLSLEEEALRIDYTVNRPEYYPRITKDFDAILDLSNHAKLSVKVKLENNNPNANFRIDLVDFHGYATNEIPFEPEVTKDGEWYTYTWDFNGKWKSGYPDPGTLVDRTMISGMEIFVNFGNTSSGSGVIWVDDITLSYTESAAEEVFVYAIETTTTESENNEVYGQATITIYDNLNQPVNGATVEGTFGGSFNEDFSGVTGEDGKVTLTTSSTTSDQSFEVCVEGVDYTNLTYNASLNTVSCSTNNSVISNTDETKFDSSLIDVYPNPANQNLNIKLRRNMEIDTLALIDIYGRIIYEKSDLNTPQININVAHLDTGLYFIRISSNKNDLIERVLIN